jgi:hypothetical protein
MNTLGKITFAALISASVLGMTATSASALIVCNGEGECWHARATYAYRPEFGLVVHPDNWRWNEGEHFAWREHAGRGYWHGGAWRRF